jgi:hypothetical protein
LRVVWAGGAERVLVRKGGGGETWRWAAEAWGGELVWPVELQVLAWRGWEP